MANEDAVPSLDELRRELEAVGMVVVPFGDEIHIRRSTLEYRYTLAEVAISRVQAVWLDVQARHRSVTASPASIPLPPPATRALAEGNAPVREVANPVYIRTPT